jgi:WD40 repeat protein
MYGHNSEINTVAFSKKGDFFATGGADSNALIWNSAFCKPKGENIK